MAGTATPIFPQTVKNFVQTFVNATGNGSAAALTLYAAGSNGSKVESLIVSSSDTSARDVTIAVLVSATLYVLTTISIPITAGLTNSAPCIDILRSTQFPGLASDANGNKYLYLASGTTLQAYLTSASVTAAKNIYFFGQAGDY